MGFLKRLSNKLPYHALLRVYKSFIKSHLDYGNIVYDKPNNDSLTSKLERVQYKGCLGITGVIQHTSRKLLNKEELDLESLGDRRWVHKLTFFYKIKKGNSPQYPSDYLKGNNNSVYNSKNTNQITLNTFKTRTENFKYRAEKGLSISVLKKTQLALFDWSNNTGAIDVKMDECVFEEKSSSKMLGLSFTSKLDWGSYIISIAKTASKKIGAIKLGWNSVAISRLVS